VHAGLSFEPKGFYDVGPVQGNDVRTIILSFQVPVIFSIPANRLTYLLMSLKSICGLSKIIHALRRSDDPDAAKPLALLNEALSMLRESTTQKLPRDWLTAAEIAAYLGMSSDMVRKTLRIYHNTGHPLVRRGGQVDDSDPRTIQYHRSLVVQHFGSPGTDNNDPATLQGD
jgi:hypothetical protein